MKNKRQTYDPAFRAKALAGYSAAPNKQAYAAKLGVPSSVLYHWRAKAAAKGRRPAGPGPRPRPPAPAPTPTIENVANMFAAYVEIERVVVKLPRDMAVAVLGIQLRRWQDAAG